MSDNANTPKPNFFIRILRALFPILIIAGACYGAYLFMSTPPTARRGAPAKIVPQVEAHLVERGAVPVHINTVGTIIASQEVSLKSKVSGTIETISPAFQPGAIVKKGDILVTLEKTDYTNALHTSEANYKKAKASYEVELGQQSIAKTELEQIKSIAPNSISTSNIQTSLTLRKPQLAQADADVAIAQVSLDNAKLDLERTEIKAPYDALVISRSVSIGQHITTSDVLAELVAIDEYWVEVPIAIDILYNNNLLSHSLDEIPVDVITLHNEAWDTKVIQVVGAITTGSRMGKVLLSIDDPLALSEANSRVPLIVGDQVKVQIEAGVYEDVVALPRSALQYNEYLWTIENSALKSKVVDVVWRDGNIIYVKGSDLPKGTLVLTSGLSNPVEGMIVKPSVDGKVITSEENTPKNPQGRPEGTPQGKPGGGDGSGKPQNRPFNGEAPSSPNNNQ